MLRARRKNNPANEALRARRIKLMLLASAAVCYSLLPASFDRAAAQRVTELTPPPQI